jgi:hypothetical protein
MTGKVFKRRILALFVVFMLAVTVLSCGGKKEEAEDKPAETTDETISYVNEEVSYGLFFDEEGTKRTLKLGKNDEEFKGYLFLMVPEYMEIASTQFRLVMPEGVAIIDDDYRLDRVISMGTFERGISERFAPCLPGPKILIHTFTFRVTAPLDNAVFSILSSMDYEFLAVAECKEGFPMVRASAFRAVVNPSD